MIVILVRLLFRFSDDEDDDIFGDSDGIDLAECFRLQHAELEMLESMFPEELKVFGSNEICGDD